MKDFQASLDKLRADAAEAALTRDLATDKAKREFYDRLYQHFWMGPAISPTRIPTREHKETDIAGRAEQTGAV